MKIVVLDGEIANPGDLSWQALAAFGELKVHNTTEIGTQAQRIGDAEIVITNKVPLKQREFEACKNLRYVGLLSTGYNIIDLQAAKQHGVVVSNVPNYSTMGVAQHTMALLLEITNHVGTHSTAVRGGHWQQSGRWSFWNHPLQELCGKTFGAVGFGNIGYATARIAQALGMRVVCAGSRPTEKGKEIAEYVSLDELLAQSDVVSLHCPLLPQTRELINKNTISKMKKGAILLNTARGGLVVEQDLADALNQGYLTAAGLDVTAIEPAPPSSPLLSAKNCYITPHIAWVATETRQRLLDYVAENLQAFLQGAPINVVNP